MKRRPTSGVERARVPISASEASATRIQEQLHGADLGALAPDGLRGEMNERELPGLAASGGVAVPRARVGDASEAGEGDPLAALDASRQSWLEAPTASEPPVSSEAEILETKTDVEDPTLRFRSSDSVPSSVGGGASGSGPRVTPMRSRRSGSDAAARPQTYASWAVRAVRALRRDRGCPPHEASILIARDLAL